MVKGLLVLSVEPMGRVRAIVRALTVLAAIVERGVGLALTFAGLAWVLPVVGLAGLARAFVMGGGEELRGGTGGALVDKGGEGLRE